MVDYSNAKIKMHIAVAEKLFRFENDQVAILWWKGAISAGGGEDFFDQEYRYLHFQSIPSRGNRLYGYVLYRQPNKNGVSHFSQVTGFGLLYS